MATLTIRNLDDDLKARLRIEAAENGRSMEEEVRIILRDKFGKLQPQQGLGSRIHRRFAAVGSVTLDLPERTDKPRTIELPE